MPRSKKLTLPDRVSHFPIQCSIRGEVVNRRPTFSLYLGELRIVIPLSAPTITKRGPPPPLLSARPPSAPNGSVPKPTIKKCIIADDDSVALFACPKSRRSSSVSGRARCLRFHPPLARTENNQDGNAWIGQLQLARASLFVT